MANSPLIPPLRNDSIVTMDRTSELRTAEFFELIARNVNQNTDDIASNLESIKSNEVLLWLSM